MCGKNDLLQQRRFMSYMKVSRLMQTDEMLYSLPATKNKTIQLCIILKMLCFVQNAVKYFIIFFHMLEYKRCMIFWWGSVISCVLEE